MKILILIYAITVCSLAESKHRHQSHTKFHGDKYQPTWDSLDKRPIPKWFNQEKFGIFMHWGVWSVPAFGAEAAFFWEYLHNPLSPASLFMKQNYPPGFTYQDFAAQFHAELFEPDQFTEIIKSSGAKYFVFTSKHHEGFTMYPSPYSWNWNSQDVGPRRDIVGELRASFEKTGGVRFGLYFSHYEWYNPLYLSDKENNYTTQSYVEMVSIPQLMEISEKYKPEVIWLDGQWEASSEYWNSTHFLAWLYNESPIKNTVLVNDRWGSDTVQKHGGFYTVEGPPTRGWLHNHTWEHCMTLDKGSWGFRRQMRAEDVHSLSSVVHYLAKTISCGGNLLLNVGPTADGRIVPIFEERLGQVGKWLEINGEAVYDTKPWIHQNDTLIPGLWYTSKLRDEKGMDPNRLWNKQTKANTIVYAFLTAWPEHSHQALNGFTATESTVIHMLGYKNPLSAKQTPTGVEVDLSSILFADLPSTEAWVLKLEYLADDSKTPYIGPF